MIRMEAECVNCKHYKGDCGKHHKDCNGHIDYDIPAEYMYDHGWLSCFDPSEEYIRKRQEERAKELSKYPIEIIERALELAKMEEVEE